MVKFWVYFQGRAKEIYVCSVRESRDVKMGKGK